MTTFDPSKSPHYATAARRDGKPGAYVRYHYGASSLVMAINAALTTNRPLLLRGEPGSGKSTLAYDVAVGLGWQYFERVISSRMTASDLLWQFDAVQQLNDAMNKTIKPAREYVRPQPLWRALDPASAGEFDRKKPSDNLHTGAVLLLDEIDKADPDLPNDLLVVLGDGRFHVTELGDDGEFSARRAQLLIVVTTNEERELPAAFLRRCVCVRLETPGPAELRTIAILHMPELAGSPFLDGWIDRMVKIRAECKRDQHRPGTAEILDAIRACHELGVTTPQHPDWKALTMAMGWKNPERPPPSLEAP